MSTKSKLTSRLILRNSNGVRIIRAWFLHRCIKFLHWDALELSSQPTDVAECLASRRERWRGTLRARSAGTRQAPHKRRPSSLARITFKNIIFFTLPPLNEFHRKSQIYRTIKKKHQNYVCTINNFCLVFYRYFTNSAIINTHSSILNRQTRSEACTEIHK